MKIQDPALRLDPATMVLVHYFLPGGVELENLFRIRVLPMVEVVLLLRDVDRYGRATFSFCYVSFYFGCAHL